ncbi:hypothetical protein GUITHDRAFT_154832 [Guillardia theta CCMP2712]|uniref:Uncharacterized protein n=1 Tax=Guillardia theta (strain CCMP2712) TaxID=905079 RepID=L1IPZ8_GUITC|nr:hypothetical protein GUITHDRAFT_154832 [Guillardia theta CCMP2712]EKX37964.1 hypothetical protein GUITHDRAFT_154832 [Guillardia theta CCMP2712]|eukprot:XP_005824944.1 hypothetical protein GUITHDRAFT_154832 [Guillardia theta CCMP2712]
MREARGSRARFLWMATPAMVHVRDNMISECMDWRTNQRLALYEEQAKTLVQRYQQEFGIERFMYMDTYNLTLPMIEAAKGDCGHFLPANIQLAAVQQFLNLAC